MRLIRRMALAGLVVMAVVAVATAIWPAVAGLVSALLVTVLSVGIAAPMVLVTRWARGELVWRRELATIAPVGVATAEVAPVEPALAELWESA